MCNITEERKRELTIKYPFIVLWSKDSRFNSITTDKSIQELQLKAEYNNAPMTAIYRRTDNSWQTIDNLSSDNEILRYYKRALFLVQKTALGGGVNS